MSEIILEVEDLRKYFPVQRSFLERLLARRLDYVRAVDGVSFRVRRGGVFTLAGETGCGKTTTGRLVARLIEPTGGKIVFEGREITHLKGKELKPIRRKIQMIFQDPYASLNPRMRIGDAIGHPLEIHGIATGKEKEELTKEMLKRVGLTPVEKFYKAYPHQLSGGERQRAVIARAMILKPDFVIADEPVSMIDVSLRARILELMMELKEELGVTYLFITHDLAVAKYVSDVIAIMYLGKLVEIAPTGELFSEPMHPYTQALLSAIPVPNPRAKRARIALRGEVPSPINPPPGCRFHPRCPFATDRCRVEEPEMIELGQGHYVACHLIG